MKSYLLKKYHQVEEELSKVDVKNKAYYDYAVGKFILIKEILEENNIEVNNEETK